MTNEEKRNIFNAINNVYNMDATTWQEVLAVLYNTVNGVKLDFEDLETRFGLLLPEEVRKMIQKLVDDGTLESIINEDLFGSFNETIENTKIDLQQSINDNVEKINTQLDEKANKFDILQKSMNKIVAHRGLSSVYPENTLFAMKKVCEFGMFGYELDIRTTLDGEFIIMHDSTVDRTTNGTGTVSDMTLDAIKRLTINSTKYPNMQVPTLEEILQVTSIFNTVPCIELKEDLPNIDKLLSLIRKYNIEHKCIIISWVPSTLRLIRSKSNVALMLNADMSNEKVDEIKDIKNIFISSPRGFCNSNNIAYAHENGVMVMAYSIDNYNDYHSNIHKGVDLVSTDILIGGI